MYFLIGGASVIRVSETAYRNYTIAYHNVEKGVLEIIFNIHGKGVGSRYIDALKTGIVCQPSQGGRKEYDPKAKQYFIFGDETSLGLACSFLPELKRNNHQLQFYFELEEENKNAPQLVGLENCTVFSKNGSFRDEKWINELPVFQTADWHTASFILTGHVKSVQTFRKVLKSRTAGKIAAQGYWLEGKKGL